MRALLFLLAVVLQQGPLRGEDTVRTARRPVVKLKYSNVTLLVAAGSGEAHHAVISEFAVRHKLRFDDHVRLQTAATSWLMSRGRTTEHQVFLVICSNIQNTEALVTVAARHSGVMGPIRGSALPSERFVNLRK